MRGSARGSDKQGGTFTKARLGTAEERALEMADWFKDGMNVESVCWVDVLTLVRIVLDFKLQLPGVGLHSVHVALQVLLVLLMSVFKLDEFLPKQNTHTHRRGHCECTFAP